MNDKKTFKIAMVGTGIIASAHLGAIKENKETALVAVADIREEAAKKVADEYGVPYFTDYKEMAEKIEIDAVILNLPHFLHCEASIFFLERGIHVLCEKPMANTLEECDRMIEAEKHSTAKLAIGHSTRHNVANKFIKELIKNKTLGELCMYTEIRTIDYFTEKRPKWFLDKKLSGGGLLMNYGAHSFETLMNVTGSEITDIDGDVGNLVNEGGVEAHALIKFKMDGKIPCSVVFCGYPSFFQEEKIFYFTNGALKEINGRKLSICDTPNGEFKPVEIESISSFVIQLEEFLKYIKGEKSNTVDGPSARKIIAAISEIYSQNGQ